MSATACAKPRRILSAYLMVTATNRPPKAFAATTPHVMAPKPCSRPYDASSGSSWSATEPTATAVDQRPSWMLRSHSEVCEVFSIISKYTAHHGHGAPRKRASATPRASRGGADPCCAE